MSPIYSKRRPYLKLKSPQLRFFKESVRFLKDIMDKESAFEKPYLDLEYRQMHFDFPQPDWPPFPSFDRPRGDYPPPCRPCHLYISHASGDCVDPIKIGPAIWCTNDPWQSGDSAMFASAAEGGIVRIVARTWSYGEVIEEIKDKDKLEYGML